MPVVPERQPELTKGGRRRATRDSKGADEALFDKAAG
jgi:hypothetical protein